MSLRGCRLVPLLTQSLFPCLLRNLIHMHASVLNSAVSPPLGWTALFQAASQTNHSSFEPSLVRGLITVRESSYLQVEWISIPRRLEASRVVIWNTSVHSFIKSSQASG